MRVWRIPNRSVTFILLTLFLPNISRITFVPSIRPAFKSFSIVCGVAKITRWLEYRFCLLWGGSCPFASNTNYLGTWSYKWSSAEICCLTRGRVGARKTILWLGNHLKKLAINIAAMCVFPSPVGKHTRVFLQTQLLTIYCWYYLNSGFRG